MTSPTRHALAARQRASRSPWLSAASLRPVRLAGQRPARRRLDRRRRGDRPDRASPPLVAAASRRARAARPLAAAARATPRWSSAYGAGRGRRLRSSATSTRSRTCRSGVALLIEYTAPVAVVAWLWLRHGQRARPAHARRRRARARRAGAGARPGLRSRPQRWSGVLWALGAMVGAATYFVLSADEGNGLPPLALAAGGLVVGARGAGSPALVGHRPDGARPPTRSTYAGVDRRRGGCRCSALGVVTAALAYVTGIAAVRRLGSRLASFVALTEVRRRRWCSPGCCSTSCPGRSSCSAAC